MEKEITTLLSAVTMGKVEIGFVLFDENKKVIYVNDFVETVTGYTKSELIGTQLFDSIVKDEKYRELSLAKLSNCYDRPFNDFDVTIVQKDGKAAVFHLQGSSFTEEGTHYAVIVIQDITKKKEFEKVIESTYDNIMQSTIDLDAALKKIKEQRRVLEEYKTKMERELNVAKTVQKAIIPKEFLRNEYVEIWGVSIPNDELGGDYFDLFRPDASKLGILIADVSGHGVPSALITTMIKVYFERYAKEFAVPENVFIQVNNEVTKTLQETGLYLTAFYSIVDLDTMIITSTCAGHDFAICYDPKKDEISQLGKTEKGTIIGTFEEAEYDSSLFQLENGNKVLFFTDGITEARNKNGDFFGIERLIKLLKKHKNKRPKEFIDLLIDELNAFSVDAPAQDDRTIIMLDVLKIPDPEDVSEEKLKTIIDTAFRNGRKYVKEKQYSAAVNEFLKIIKFDSNSSGAYSYLGQVFGIFGDFEKAEECLNKAIELNRSYVQGYYFLGIILYKEKKYEEAKACWLKLKEIAGDFKNVDDYIKKLEKMGI
ncbi:MAG: SpoIIE family protein phosphatase [Spirochaetales bacterium]|nr:SpoIIE family protein phosphatase [Spirochaetales bacterium]